MKDRGHLMHQLLNYPDENMHEPDWFNATQNADCVKGYVLRVFLGLL